MFCCMSKHQILYDELEVDNFALLQLAGELGLVRRQDAASASQAYLAFRARHHLARNNNESESLIEKHELLSERQAVQALWEVVFGGVS